MSSTSSSTIFTSSEQIYTLSATRRRVWYGLVTEKQRERTVKRISDILGLSTETLLHLIQTFPVDITYLDGKILIYLLSHLDERSIPLERVRYLIETRPIFAFEQIPLLTCAHAMLIHRQCEKIVDARELRTVLRPQRRDKQADGGKANDEIPSGQLKELYLGMQDEAFKVEDEDLACLEGLALDTIDPRFARFNLFGLVSTIFGPDYDRVDELEHVLLASYPIFFPVHLMGPELLFSCMEHASASCIAVYLIQPTFTIESFLDRPNLTIAWYLLQAYGITALPNLKHTEALPEHFRGTASVIARELQDGFQFASFCEVADCRGFDDNLADMKVMGKWVRDVHGEQKRSLAEIIFST